MTGAGYASEAGDHSEHGGRDRSDADTPRASKRASCAPNDSEKTRDQEDGIEANAEHVTAPIPNVDGTPEVDTA